MRDKDLERLAAWNLALCRKAELEHRKSKRQYAHVFHKPNNVICVCRAFFLLPEKHQKGIYLHEIGHLLAGRRASEAKANQAVLEEYRIEIKYVSGPYGKNLEWVD